jgi:hypothetical protein
LFILSPVSALHSLWALVFAARERFLFLSVVLLPRPLTALDVELAQPTVAPDADHLGAEGARALVTGPTARMRAPGGAGTQAV